MFLIVNWDKMAPVLQHKLQLNTDRSAKHDGNNNSWTNKKLFTVSVQLHVIYMFLSDAYPGARLFYICTQMW